MPNIDDLSIKISASSSKAAREIDRLSSVMTKLGGSASDAAQKVQVLDDGMEKVTQSTSEFGSVFRGASKWSRIFGQDADKAGKSAKKSASGIDKFWQALKRVAYYRIIRSVLKSIAEGFREGISNLYQWSSAVNGHFAKSMDSLATSVLYLKNSLGALAAPLIEALAPALDVIVDKIVHALNFFNMLISAISGKETYTVAKKVATEWGNAASTVADNAHSASEDIKRTLMGFDEINQLALPDKGSGGGGYGGNSGGTDFSAMFEERPLTGLFATISDISSGIQEATKKWPSWLKWLLGIGAAAGAAWGLKQLPGLLGKLFSALKRLIGIDLPDWLKRLFGGGGGGKDGDGSGHYDLDVDLKKGDWEVLDELKDSTALVPVGLQHWGWDNIQDWIGNAVTVMVALRHWGWDNIQDWIGWAVTIAVGLKHWGWTTIEDWIGRAVTVAVALSHWGWNNIEDWIGSAVTVHVGLRKWGWNNIEDWIGSTITANVGLNKWGWESLSEWTGADKGILVNVGLFHWGWTTIQDWIGSAVSVAVMLKKNGWTSLQEWSGADAGIDVPVNLLGATALAVLARIQDAFDWADKVKDFVGNNTKVKVKLVKDGWTTLSEWIGDEVNVNIALKHFGWETIENWIGTAITVAVGLKRWGWKSLSAWVGDTVPVYVNLKKGNYSSLSDWIGTAVNVKVNLKASGGVVTSNSNRTFGNATGGGDNSSRGGGSGRQRHYASGGIISGNAWRSIPQYAGGTLNAHGSLFLAGEAGAELVGHIGGRTEVLNRSQLAATMHDSVARAIHPAVSAMMYMASANSNTFTDTVSDGSGDTFNHSALASAIVSALKQAGVGAVYLDGRMLAQSINNESRRIGRAAIRA